MWEERHGCSTTGPWWQHWQCLENMTRNLCAMLIPKEHGLFSKVQKCGGGVCLGVNWSKSAVSESLSINTQPFPDLLFYYYFEPFAIFSSCWEAKHCSSYVIEWRWCSPVKHCGPKTEDSMDNREGQFSKVSVHGWDQHWHRTKGGERVARILRSDKPGQGDGRGLPQGDTRFTGERRAESLFLSCILGQVLGRFLS